MRNVSKWMTEWYTVFGISSVLNISTQKQKMPDRINIWRFFSDVNATTLRTCKANRWLDKNWTVMKLKYKLNWWGDEVQVGSRGGETQVWWGGWGEPVNRAGLMSLIRNKERPIPQVGGMLWKCRRKWDLEALNHQFHLHRNKTAFKYKKGQFNEKCAVCLLQLLWCPQVVRFITGHMFMFCAHVSFGVKTRLDLLSKFYFISFTFISTLKHLIPSVAEDKRTTKDKFGTMCQ